MQPCWVLQMILCHCRQFQPKQTSNEEYECLTNASFFAATVLESIKENNNNKYITNSNFNKTGTVCASCHLGNCSHLESKHFDDKIF